MTPRAKRIALIAAVGVTVWFAAVIVLWAVPAQSDAVPVGVDVTQTPPRRVSVEIDCNSLFDSAPRDDSPLPALKPQPQPAAQLAYQREPCTLVHHNARLVLGIDIAAYVLVMAAGAFVLARQRRAGHASVANALT